MEFKFDNKYFNGFMIFLGIIFTVIFFTLGVNFLISFITSLVLVIVLRGFWILYELFLKLCKKIDLSKFRKANKNEKRKV